MRKAAVFAATLAAVWLVWAQVAMAEWPAYPLKPGWSGPGFYLSWVKILACWLVFLVWVRTVDWVSRDGQEFKLDYLRWNPIVFGPFVGVFVLVWIIPWFWLGFPLLVIAAVAPVTVYVLERNKKVDEEDRVFTPAHLRRWFARRARVLGVKVAAEKKDPYAEGPPVLLTPRGGPSEQDHNVRLLSARHHPGFNLARVVLGKALFRRAEAVMLDYAQESVAVKCMIDGVWHEGEPLDREKGDSALEALKVLCGLNAQDRQNRQEGTFAAQYLTTSLNGTLVSQGTAAGERVVMQFVGTKALYTTLDAMGMRTKMQEQLKELLAAESGFVLFSALPANGLRTTMTVALRSTDRFMREFVAVEEASNRYEQIENVPVTVYKAAEREKLPDTLDKLFHQEPNAVVFRDLPDGQIVGLLCEEVPKKRLIVSSMRAKDCAEALLRVLALKAPPEEFARSVTGVLNQRLIRRLCEKCKEPYAPEPQLLQRLGIPEGRVQAFYRPPQPAPDEKKEVCPACGGIGYIGRTAMFELLVVDDTIRNVLTTTPKLDVLRQAARKAGMRSLQEEGILLVAKGATSLPELLRVLKQ